MSDSDGPPGLIDVSGSSSDSDESSVELECSDDDGIRQRAPPEPPPTGWRGNAQQQASHQLLLVNSMTAAPRNTHPLPATPDGPPCVIKVSDLSSGDEEIDCNMDDADANGGRQRVPPEPPPNHQETTPTGWDQPPYVSPLIDLTVDAQCKDGSTQDTRTRQLGRTTLPQPEPTRRPRRRNTRMLLDEPPMKTAVQTSSVTEAGMRLFSKEHAAPGDVVACFSAWHTADTCPSQSVDQ